MTTPRSLLRNPARREFLREAGGAAAIAVAAVPLLGAALSACTGKSGGSAPPAGETPVSTTEPVAQALGYVEDAAKVDTAKWAKKAGPDGAGQRCDTCVQYTALNPQWGRCAIFPGKVVTAAGWCNTWVAKPAS